MTFSPTDCDRARESFSAELDEELPELERERLSLHLIGCPDCSAWAAEVRDATRRLREATLEAPPRRVVLPKRGRRWTVGPAVAVSSAAALVASLVVAIGPQSASLGSQPSILGDTPGSSHPLGGAKLFTGHPVTLAKQLGVALPVAIRKAADSTRVPA